MNKPKFNFIKYYVNSHVAILRLMVYFKRLNMKIESNYFAFQ